MISINLIYIETESSGNQVLYLIKPSILITYDPRLTQIRVISVIFFIKLPFASFQKKMSVTF